MDRIIRINQVVLADVFIHTSISIVEVAIVNAVFPMWLDC